MAARRWVAGAGALLGFLGVLGCLAGMAVALWLGVRLSRANDRAAAAADRVVVRAGELVSRARARVQALPVEDLEAAIREWGRREVGRELAERFDARAQRVRDRLEQAEARIDASSASVQSLARALDVLGAVKIGGGRGDADEDDRRALARAADRLDDLDARLQEAIQTVDVIRQRAAALVGEAARRERIDTLLSMAAALNAALDRIDAGLGEAAGWLADCRVTVERSRVVTRRYIIAGVIATVAILAWLAAGQAALCAWGWRRLQTGRGERAV